MKTRSRKNKGSRLQKWVRDDLRDRYSEELEPDDINSAIMGDTGADIKLSPAAKKLIPFEFECKYQERFGGIYDIMAQAANHGDGVPLGVIKMNRKDPLVIVDAKWFFDKVLKNE